MIIIFILEGFLLNDEIYNNRMKLIYHQTKSFDKSTAFVSRGSLLGTVTITEMVNLLLLIKNVSSISDK